MIEWESLPGLLEQWIDEEKERLTGELDERDTLKLRTRIAVYRRILSLAKPDPYAEATDDDE